ncbi:tail fiber protein [Intrasporangium calvum]|uniref:Tail fiber protein n=1 Tax=Intrasporangium calvum TaxID=53358 RepID=A0ABT5GJQ2_9MICO|nr:tail fiber protein [Intrasporangium calvum]MDC5698473.1 tail fiber protein [Intrasporangium calvum]
MTEPFLGEIRLLSFIFAPKGWALCNGQLLPINQNQALFALLGTTYGGDGQVNFALPDLRGRVPIQVGAGHTQGERGGEQAHTLTAAELPTHTHAQQASSASATTGVTGPGVMKASSVGSFAYGSAQNLVPMDSSAIGTVGGTQPHQNMQPYLTISFCIALQGIFPSQN